jgi:hypothetical protein
MPRSPSPSRLGRRGLRELPVPPRGRTGVDSRLDGELLRRQPAVLLLLDALCPLLSYRRLLRRCLREGGLREHQAGVRNATRRTDT